MNNKVLAVILALGIATTLGACGGGGSEPAASPTGATSPAMSASPTTSPKP